MMNNKSNSGILSSAIACLVCACVAHALLFNAVRTQATELNITDPVRWGNHADAGYLDEAELDALYLSITNNFLDASTITNLVNAKEDALGNPLVDDYVLSSKTDGTRSWVENAGGGLTDSLWSINLAGYLVPRTNDVTDAQWEININGHLVPKEVL